MCERLLLAEVEKKIRETSILVTNRLKSKLWQLQAPGHKSWATLVVVQRRDLKATPVFVLI